MVPRGFWDQENIDSFCKDVKSNEVNIGQRMRPTFEYHGTILQGNKYVAPDLDEVVMGDKYRHLDKEKKQQLVGLLKKHERMFQVKRGVWKGSDVMLQLKDEAKPYLAKPYSVPFPQREQFLKELER